MLQDDAAPGEACACAFLLALDGEDLPMVNTSAAITRTRQGSRSAAKPCKDSRAQSWGVSMIWASVQI